MKPWFTFIIVLSLFLCVKTIVLVAFFFCVCVCKNIKGTAAKDVDLTQSGRPRGEGSG